jgi:hypothetical protein
MDNPPAMMIDLPKAHRMMKFATAAYGPQVIANAVFESGERMPPAPTASTRSAVMKHVGIENNDENIVVMDLDAGEDLEYLRHYCVIDHAHKAVALAVRGTLSISSTMVNCAGYCDDFLCDGTKAHSGMAKMTRGIWNKSGEAIVVALKKHDDYEFIVCGHSLGAGVAGLLHVWVHQEQLIPSKTTTECFLYGGPPTLSSMNKNGVDDNPHLQSAIQNTTFFMYKRDIVPFLSVDSIRRFFRLVAAVDQLKIPLWKKVLMDHEVLAPTEDILAAYQQAVEENDDDATMPTIEKAPTVYVPAKTIVWIEPKPRTRRRLAVVWRPFVRGRSIRLHFAIRKKS